MRMGNFSSKPDIYETKLINFTRRRCGAAFRQTSHADYKRQPKNNPGSFKIGVIRQSYTASRRIRRKQKP